MHIFKTKLLSIKKVELITLLGYLSSCETTML